LWFCEDRLGVSENSDLCEIDSNKDITMDANDDGSEVKD